MGKSFILILFFAFLLIGVTAVSAVTLLAPANIVATPVSPTAIDLSWASSTGAVGYDIYRNGTSTPLATTTGLFYMDTGLQPNTLYTYNLDAFDASGTRSVLSADVATTTQSDVTAPSIPTGFLASPISASQIDLSWFTSVDNVGVAGYRIYRDNSLLASTASTSYGDVGLTASTTYAYQVSAFDAANNESARSATSSAKTLATGTATTTNVTAAIISGTGSGNSINLALSNIISLAVYGSDSLNPNDIKFDTVRFAGAGAVFSNFENVNTNGQTVVNRVVYGFRVQDMKDLSVGDTKAIFTADTNTGQHLFASVPVTVINNPNPTSNTIESLIKRIEDKIAAIRERIQLKIDEINQRIGNITDNTLPADNDNTDTDTIVSSNSVNSVDSIHSLIVNKIENLRKEIESRMAR